MVFCVQNRKTSKHKSLLVLVAEKVGFEPTCPVKDKTISSRSRYDHFDTSPYGSKQFSRKLLKQYTTVLAVRQEEIISFPVRLHAFVQWYVH